MAIDQKMINEFYAMPKLAFGCIDKEGSTPADARQKFIKALEDRCVADPTHTIGPRLIDQVSTNMCGPASFMYCVAREYPDEYAKYVLSLAMHGKGSIGSLTVSPPNAATVEIGGDIAPVDWVALASIRDDKTLSRMTSAKTGIGGMTFPGPLTDWFNKTGLFKATNETSPVPKALFTSGSGSLDEPTTSLNDLLKINNSPADYVCLLVRARIFKAATSMALGNPDHWVVMTDNTNNNRIKITTQSGQTLMPIPLGTEVVMTYPGDFLRVDENIRKERERLEAGTLNFRVYTWGDIVDINASHGGRLTVKRLLADYFGFVRVNKI